MTTETNAAAMFITELLDNDIAGHIRELTRDDVPHPKSGRMQSIKAPLFFKGVRDGRHGCLDLFCDLVCADFGQLLGVPTPPQVVVNHPGVGLGLVSPYLDGENGIAVETYDELVNTEDVPLLCCFEEWVMNTDDKQPHFWTVPASTEKRLYIVDHGHTLHRANNFDGVDSVADHPKIRSSVGKRHYQFTALEEVQPGIDRIREVTDAEIRSTVESALDELRALDADHSGLSTFLEEAEYHRALAVTILRYRRDHLTEIMREKVDDGR